MTIPKGNVFRFCLDDELLSMEGWKRYGSIVDPRVVDITFILERAEMLGIEIPTTELVEATEVFHSIG